MVKDKRHLIGYRWPGFSAGLVLTGMAFIMLFVSCSQNGGQMADKKGERETPSKQNSAVADQSWHRVIVHLNVPDMEQMKKRAAMLKDPEAASALDEKIAKQIAMVADKVLAKVKPAGATLIRRYDTLPLLALKASPQAVTLMHSMPEVRTVEKDHLNQPMR